MNKTKFKMCLIKKNGEKLDIDLYNALCFFKNVTNKIYFPFNYDERILVAETHNALWKITKNKKQKPYNAKFLP